jgi:hypothetical protein
MCEIDSSIFESINPKDQDSNSDYLIRTYILNPIKNLLTESDWQTYKEIYEKQKEDKNAIGLVISLLFH